MIDRKQALDAAVIAVRDGFERGEVGLDNMLPAIVDAILALEPQSEITHADLDASAGTPQETSVRLDWQLQQCSRLERDSYVLKARVRELEARLEVTDAMVERAYEAWCSPEFSTTPEAFRGALVAALSSPETKEGFMSTVDLVYRGNMPHVLSSRRRRARVSPPCPCGSCQVLEGFCESHREALRRVRVDIEGAWKGSGEFIPTARRRDGGSFGPTCTSVDCMEPRQAPAPFCAGCLESAE